MFAGAQSGSDSWDGGCGTIATAPPLTIILGGAPCRGPTHFKRSNRLLSAGVLRKGERELVSRKGNLNLVDCHYVQALSTRGGEWLASFS
jgi:hypothetical protein